MNNSTSSQRRFERKMGVFTALFFLGLPASAILKWETGSGWGLAGWGAVAVLWAFLGLTDRL